MLVAKKMTDLVLRHDVILTEITSHYSLQEETHFKTRRHTSVSISVCWY